MVMKIRDLPNRILNQLWNFEYKEDVADVNKFRSLPRELERFGYKITDEDYAEGEYNDLKAYLDVHIKKIKRTN